jgi:hypothetical protein
MKACDYAYMAGLFDGEGCIQLLKQTVRKNGQTTPLYLIISIRNTDSAVMRWVADVWGGRLDDVKAYSRNCSRSWYWTQCSNEALATLQLIRPYLKIKAEECDVALKFQKHVVKYKHEPYPRKGLGRGRPIIPPEVLEYRIHLAEQLKAIRLSRKRYDPIQM